MVLIARNRRRPNIRHDPVEAFPATETQQGAWTLADPLKLYLTPLYLVVLKNDAVP